MEPANFQDDTSSTTINAFLKQLQMEPANTTFTIYPTVLSFSSKASKNQQQSNQSTPEGQAEYQACDRIQAVKNHLQVNRTILWLSGSLFKIDMSGGDNKWHAYIVIYHQGKLIVVDPDYAGKPEAVRRVKDLKGLGLFRQLHQFIIGGSGEKVGGETCCRRAVSEIRIRHTSFGVAVTGIQAKYL